MSDDLASRALRNRIGGFLFGLSWISMLIFFIMDERWAHSAPTRPDRMLGQVYAHNEHGWITYFTAFQATSSALMFWSCFVGGGVAIAILPKRQITVRRWGRMPLAASWKNDDPIGLAKSNALYGTLIAPVVIFLLGPIVIGWLNRNGIVLNL